MGLFDTLYVMHLYKTICVIGTWFISILLLWLTMELAFKSHAKILETIKCYKKYKEKKKELLDFLEETKKELK